MEQESEEHLSQQGNGDRKANHHKLSRPMLAILTAPITTIMMMTKTMSSIPLSGNFMSRCASWTRRFNSCGNPTWIYLASWSDLEVHPTSSQPLQPPPLLLMMREDP